MSTTDDRVHELVARFGAPDACLAELLCDGHDPDAVAFVLVRDDFTTESITYGELRQRSERIAAGLLELGVSDGDSVATLMGKSADYLATLVAIWRIGAAHVPLFTAFAPPAIGMRLEGSAARVIVTDTDQRRKLDALGPARRRRVGLSCGAATTGRDFRTATSTSLISFLAAGRRFRRRASAVGARWCACTHREPLGGPRGSSCRCRRWQRGSCTWSTACT